MVEEPLYVMSPMETAWGIVVGNTGEATSTEETFESPRKALERVVRTALQRAPCGVAFSGGRDSSVVLAIATHVARRDGLSEPIPITRVFPTVPEADEREWQEGVVRHLGLRDWHRVVIHDELDVVGPIAREHLVDHGVLWPPAIAGDVPLVEAVPGGSVIDGEGGDEVLGVGAHRIAPLAHLLNSPRPVSWRRCRSAAATLAPAAVRGRREARRFGTQPLTWLRPAAKAALVAAMERVERERPLSFARGVRMVRSDRSHVLGSRNRRTLAQARGVDFSSPLLHPDVVEALAREGGVVGRGSRSQVLRSLAGDLLPDQVLGRTSKADFTRCYMGRHTREFATEWSGDGVDDELVDAEQLKQLWLASPPLAPTSAILQAAWLVSREKLPSAGTGNFKVAVRADP
jgi:asparagine synthase (glutamine-hydrolysing)